MREFRNHTSAVIRRVENGETIHVTVHGRAVVELRAIPEQSETAWLDDLRPTDTGWLESVRSERQADMALDWVAG